MENHEANHGEKKAELTARGDARPNVSADASTPIPAATAGGDDRPLGVTLLATVYAIGGICLFGTLNSLTPQTNDTLWRLGLSPGRAWIAIGLLGALAAAAAVGMFLKKRWGWWLGAFFLTYAIARNASVLLALPDLARQFHQSARNIAFQYASLGARIAIDTLLCWYFFTPRVETFFAVSTIPRLKRVIYLTLATIGVVLAVSASRFILLSSGQ